MADKPIVRIRREPDVQKRIPSSRKPRFPRKASYQAQAELRSEAFSRIANDVLRIERGIDVSVDPSAVAPDRALIFEVVGPVAKFAEAAIETGFGWLTEDYSAAGAISDSDVEETGEQTSGSFSRLYLTMPTMAGLKKLLALWKRYSGGNKPNDKIETRWWNLFGYLSDVRIWSERDRIEPTLIIQVTDLLARDSEALIRMELDLWYHSTEDKRQTAREGIGAILEIEEAEILDEQIISQINFHGLLISLPAPGARRLVQYLGPLASASMVMTIRPQSLAVFDLPAKKTRDRKIRAVPRAPDARQPLAVLLDGYPVQSHRLLRNRLDIEEVDIRGTDAPLDTRSHGTTMASLIVHGDLAHDSPPLERVLKVVPILAASQGALVESTPTDKLPIAMVLRAVEAMVGPDGAAPEAVLFNHSFSDVAAPFVRRPTAWAKLLDYLSHKHGILFVVSAGNVHTPFSVPDYTDLASFKAGDPDERGLAVLRAVEAAKGTRGILSPAEAVNVLTVGALHEDGAPDQPTAHVNPFGFASANLCSSVGLGINRAVKPDMVMAGGRQVALPVPSPDGFSVRGWEVVHLGQQAAAPDEHGGTLDHVRRSTGTSNAAALTTRSGILIAEALQDIIEDAGERWEDLKTRAVMVKALLIHGCRWGDIGRLLDGAYPPVGTQKWRRRRETITRFLGFGRPQIEQVIAGDTNRVTLLADDEITAGGLHEYRIPIPTALRGSRELRRITLTLAWTTPIHPSVTVYRGIGLDIVDAKGTRQFWKAVSSVPQPHPDDCRRGTTIHLIYEGSKKVTAIPAEGLFIGVQARELHPAFTSSKVPYSLAVTIEVAQSVRADIHADVASRARLRTRARQRDRIRERV